MENHKINFEDIKGQGEYRGIPFEIWHDEYPINPFEEWDCEPPTMTSYDRNNTDYSKGAINNFLSNEITDGQLLRHQKNLLELLELNLEDYECKEDKISDMRYEISNTEDFKILAEVATITKTKHSLTYSRGYSPGDYADLFILITPDYLKLTGVNPKDVDDEFFESTAELWGNWAWGSVYGFTIDDEDSCGGFYGDDHDKSGLLDHVKAEIDATISQQEERRLKRLKTMIKNNVPITHRKKELETATL